MIDITNKIFFVLCMQSLYMIIYLKKWSPRPFPQLVFQRSLLNTIYQQIINSESLRKQKSFIEFGDTNCVLSPNCIVCKCISTKKNQHAIWFVLNSDPVDKHTIYKIIIRECPYVNIAGRNAMLYCIFINDIIIICIISPIYEIKITEYWKCNHDHLPMILLSIGFYSGLSRNRKLKHSPFCHCHSVERAKLESKIWNDAIL